MRKAISDLPEFAAAVGHRWGQLMTGGVIIAGVTFYRDSLGNGVATAFNLGLSVLFFGMAAFGAWRDKKGVADQAAADLQAHVTRQQTVQDVHDFGNSYIPLMKEGQALLEHRPIPHSGTMEEMQPVLDWQHRVKARLEGAIKPSAFLEYEEIVAGMGGIKDHTFTTRQECAKLPKQIQFLRRIIDDPQAFKPPL